MIVCLGLTDGQHANHLPTIPSVLHSFGVNPAKSHRNYLPKNLVISLVFALFAQVNQFLSLLFDLDIDNKHTQVIKNTMKQIGLLHKKGLTR